MTTYSLQLDHRALALQCDSDLEPQAHWLLQTLAQFDRRGKGLANGVTVQVGWSLLSINQHHQLLAVHEPDYGTNPFTNTVADVSRTLRVLTQQREMLVRTNTTEQGAIPRFDEKIVLRKGCLLTQRIYLDRSTPSAGDSGWYIGSVEDTDEPSEPALPEGYEAIYVYQLLEQRPTLLPVLGLPIGYMVIFAGTTIEAIYNEQGLSLAKP